MARTGLLIAVVLGVAFASACEGELHVPSRDPASGAAGSVGPNGGGEPAPGGADLAGAPDLGSASAACGDQQCTGSESCASCPADCGACPSGGALRWSSGYLSTWWGLSPTASYFPWSSLTHVLHFQLNPRTDGTLTTVSGSQALTQAAHAHGKKALICIGGWGTGPGFTGATSSATIDTFIDNIVSYMQSNGYDGVDLDWEDDMNGAQYLALVEGLAARFDQITPRPLLTIALAGWILTDMGTANFAKMVPYLDQINDMSYYTTPAKAATELARFTAAGAPMSKLGIGFGLGDPSDPGEVDTTVAAVQAKCDWAKANGVGVMQWYVDVDYHNNGSSMPLMNAFAPYLQ